MPRISLIIPLYNEEKSIPHLIPQLLSDMEKERLDYELILVDNGSTDGTSKEIEKHASRAVKKIRLPVNQGFGGGIMEGMAHARGRWVGYMPGDGQVSSRDTVNVMKMALEGKYDLIKTVRSDREDGLLRAIASVGYNTLFRVVFSIKEPDVNGHPKMIRKDALVQMGLKSRDSFIDSELIIKASRMGLKVGSASIKFHKRSGGKSSVRPAIVPEFLLNLARFRLLGANAD
jgi:glycosyltransferase involved in cell wall biosynthesis